MRALIFGFLALTLVTTVRAAETGAAKGAGVSMSAAQKEKPKRSFESWLKDLKKRVARTRARPNQLVAVAAIRGEEKDIAPKLYWKGRKSSGPVDGAELDDFEKAIDSALAGDPEAHSKLQAFLSAHPKSSLAADARSALNRLSADATP